MDYWQRHKDDLTLYPLSQLSIAPALEEVRGPEPMQQRQNWHADSEDTYEKLLKMETEKWRAE